MKFQKFIILFFLLSGCYAGPKFYENTQGITIYRPQNTILKIDDKVVQGNTINIERSFWSLNGTITKEGFKDKTFIIGSKLTNDKWAEIDDGWNGIRVASALKLLPPSSTIRDTFVGPLHGPDFIGADPWSDPVYVFLGNILGFFGGLVYGVGHDVYNTVYSIPAVIIMNPWYEYEKYIDLSTEILEPTNEFLKECHTEKDKFIGNNSCISCQINDEIYAISDECNRCKNREWQDGICKIKK